MTPVPVISAFGYYHDWNRYWVHWVGGESFGELGVILGGKEVALWPGALLLMVVTHYFQYLVRA